MRVMFVNYAFENHGSAQDIYNYTQVARSLGHEVALYGPADSSSAFNYSQDLDVADAVVFIFEFTTRLNQGDKMDYARLLSKVPKERRVVLDCDGKYNDRICISGDSNHAEESASSLWMETCNALSDKIFQPSFHPLKPKVRPFFFHGYSPAWERPLTFNGKEFGMFYVGTSWYRWGPMRKVLQAIEPIRSEVGRIGLVGLGWDAFPPDVSDNYRAAFYSDPDELKRLGVEVGQSVSFDQVVDCMSKGTFNPVLLRPLFDHLRFVTCRTFETLAANTITLFCQDAEYIREIYGDAALELVLDEDPSDRIHDVLRRPEHYAKVVMGVREYLAQEYSYTRQFHQLLDIVRS